MLQYAVKVMEVTEDIVVFQLLFCFSGDVDFKSSYSLLYYYLWRQQLDM